MAMYLDTAHTRCLFGGCSNTRTSLMYTGLRTKAASGDYQCLKETSLDGDSETSTSRLGMALQPRNL